MWVFIHVITAQTRQPRAPHMWKHITCSYFYWPQWKRLRSRLGTSRVPPHRSSYGLWEWVGGQRERERGRKKNNRPQMILLWAWASIYWSSSDIPYGVSQSPNSIQEESGGRETDWERPSSSAFNKSSRSGGLWERGGGITVLSSYRKYCAWIPHNALHTHRRPPMATHWSREKIWKEINNSRAGHGN